MLGFFRKKLVSSLPGGRKVFFWKKQEETGRNGRNWKKGVDSGKHTGMLWLLMSRFFVEPSFNFVYNNITH